MSRRNLLSHADQKPTGDLEPKSTEVRQNPQDLPGQVPPAAEGDASNSPPQPSKTLAPPQTVQETLKTAPPKDVDFELITKDLKEGELPVYKFKDFKETTFIVKNEKSTIRLAKDQYGVVWVVKRNKHDRELPGQNQQKEKEKTAREVFLAEIARFLDPHLPEHRIGRDDKGNYYVLSRLAKFTSLKDVLAGKLDNDQKIDYKELIKKGQIKGAARAGINAFMTMDSDLNLENLGLFEVESSDSVKQVVGAQTGVQSPGASVNKLAYVSENGHKYVLGQLDKGQAGLPASFKKSKGTKNKAAKGGADLKDYENKETKNYQPSPANIEQNPFLRSPEEGSGYNPNLWFDLITNGYFDVEPSKLLDIATPDILEVRAETNETLLNAHLLTNEIITAIADRVYGQFWSVESLEQTVMEQREATVNAAMSAHQTPVKENCFRNYVYRQSLPENAVNGSPRATQAAKKHLETFTTCGQHLFQDGHSKALEDGIDAAFQSLSERAVTDRAKYGTGEKQLVEAKATAGNPPSKLQQFCATLSACCQSLCCCCCEGKPEVAQSEAAAKTGQTPPAEKDKSIASSAPKKPEGGSTDLKDEKPAADKPAVVRLEIGASNPINQGVERQSSGSRFSVSAAETSWHAPNPPKQEGASRSQSGEENTGSPSLRR